MSARTPWLACMALAGAALLGVVARGAAEQAGTQHWNTLLFDAAPQRNDGRTPGRIAGKQIAPAWAFEAPEEQLSPPLTAADGTLYLASSAGMRALDASGHVQWFAKLGSIAGTPAFLPSGELLVTRGDGRLTVLARDGRVREPSAQLPRVFRPPLVAGSGALIAGDLAGIARAFELSGLQLEAASEPLSPPLTAAALDAHTFALTGRDARVTWLSLATGVVHMFPLPARVMAGPVTSIAPDGQSDVWLVTDDDRVLRLDADGRVTLSLHPARGLRPTLAVGHDGHIRVIDIYGMLVCLDRDGKDVWRRPLDGNAGPLTLDAGDTTLAVLQRGDLYGIDAQGRLRFHVDVHTAEQPRVVVAEDGTLLVASRGLLQAWR